MSGHEDEAAGWRAIEAAFRHVYGDQEPKHWGTIIPFSLGGKDPLHGISAYRAVVAGRHHWHFVSYGLTELWAKQSARADISGWGFEFTFRLACPPAEETPPLWAVCFLQNLARYVIDSGCTFSIGDHMNCNGPIAADRATRIRAFCCVQDADLPDPVESPNGMFRFVQIFGITLAELEEVVAWNTDRVADHFRAKDSHLITDLERDDFHGDAALRSAIVAGSAGEPSSTGVLYIAPLALSPRRLFRRRRRLTIGANAVPSVIRLVQKRLGFAHDLRLVSGGTEVSLRPATRDAPHEADTVTLDGAELAALAERLQAKAGLYHLSSRLEIEVLRSEIRDGDGRMVASVG